MTTQTMHAPSNLKRIEIRGLYGDRNVRLNFREPYKILVDQNGAGKTTLIYLITNLLQGNLSKLSKYIFSSIIFTFEGENIISVENRDILTKGDEDALQTCRKLISILPQYLFLILADRIGHLSLETAYNVGLSDVAIDASKQSGIPSSKIERDIVKMLSNIGYYEQLKSHYDVDEPNPKLPSPGYLILDALAELSEPEEKVDKAKKMFGFSEILYFPTYRLIEENLETLGLSNLTHRTLESSQLIQFGMQNVEARFHQITEKIKELSLKGFSEVSSHMVDELIDGIQSDEVDYGNIEEREKLEIVLARSGDSISQERKDGLIELVTSGKLREPSMLPLAYLLSNLIKVYQKQLEQDNAIKEFIKIVNQYFAEGSEKYFDYDESNLKIQILDRRSENVVPLDKLSSGEKQIVSIFSKLYLQGDRQYAIFFDEPELSLSMEWQKKLLEDIVNSGRCSFLLAATHSPFIFDNSLAKYADVLEVEYL